MSDSVESNTRQHVDESDEYSQMFGIVIGHPPQCDLFREVEGGYEIDATPNSELRELRKDMLQVSQQAVDAGNEDEGHVLKSFADELEALIDE